MVQIRFGIKFTPRNAVRKFTLQQKTWNKASDTYLKQMQRRAKMVTKREAPGPGNYSKGAQFRTGMLRAGIVSSPIKHTSRGKIDRRANITITSTAPHTKYVVAGARPSTGDGKKPGSGKFIPQGAGGFRIKFGIWPGFKANDFLIRSQVKLNKVNSQLTRIFFNTMSATHRRLGNGA